MQRRAFALAALGLLGSGLAQAGQGVTLPTRLVQLATQAELDLLAAIKSGDVNQLEAIVSEDFHMIVAQQPGSPVAGPDWVDAVRAQPGAADYRIEQMIAREAGNTVLASFRLKPPPAKPGQPARHDVFVVDLWQTDGPRWQLLVRHAGLTGGAVTAIPGYVAPEAAPPKKY